MLARPVAEHGRQEHTSCNYYQFSYHQYLTYSQLILLIQYWKIYTPHLHY